MALRSDSPIILLHTALDYYYQDEFSRNSTLMVCMKDVPRLTENILKSKTWMMSRSIPCLLGRRSCKNIHRSPCLRCHEGCCRWRFDIPHSTKRFPGYDKEASEFNASV